MQALLHASNAASRKLVLQWVAATDLEDAVKDEVSSKFRHSSPILSSRIKIQLQFIRSIV